MQNIFRSKAGLIVPAIAALVALSATQAWADEAPPVPAKVVKKQPPQAHQAHQAHQAGMKHGATQMHDEMMHDHQMGVNASGGMQMGCGGAAGCKDKMPVAPTKPDQAPPAANMPAAPMSDHM